MPHLDPKIEDLIERLIEENMETLRILSRY